MDIVIGADPLGPEDQGAVAEAHEHAWARFVPLLSELMDEWALLRLPVQAGHPCPLQGGGGGRVWTACVPLWGRR